MKVKSHDGKIVDMGRASSINVVPLCQALRPCSFLQYRDNVTNPTLGNELISYESSTPTPSFPASAEQPFRSQLSEKEGSGGGQDMFSSNLSLLSSANADSGHHYPAQSTVAQRPLPPQPSYDATAASHMHVAAPSQDAALDQQVFAQFFGAGKEAKSSADLSGPARLQVKLEGPSFCRRNEQPSRSNISFDQAMAGVWTPFASNQDDSMGSQVPSTHSVSDAVRLLSMTAGGEDTTTANCILRANSQVDMKTARAADMGTETCHGYSQLKAAASVLMGSSSLHERSADESFAASGHASTAGVLSDWFQPLSRSSSSYIEHNLPEHLMRPAFHGNLQTAKSASHEHECNLSGNRPAYRRELLRQQYNSSTINEGSYGSEQDPKNISYQGEAQAEALDFHAQRFNSVEHDEGNLRIYKGSEPQLAHIPVSMLVQNFQQLAAAGAGSAEWDHAVGDFRSIGANAATKELLLLNRVHAASSCTVGESSNNIIPQGSSAYDAENNGDVVMDTRQLLHRSSLHDHYNPLATLSRVSTHQLLAGDQVLPAAGGHQSDTVGNTNPNIPLGLSWDESFCKEENQKLVTIITPTSLVMQQAQPVRGAIRSTISGNGVSINHSGLQYPAASFSRSHQSAPLLPNIVAGGLSRYIQPEDLSLRGPSSDLLSLDCTYTRSGSLSVIRTSKYLKPAQQLLEECCNVKSDYPTRAPDCSVESKEARATIDRSSAPKPELSAEERCQVQMRKARLIGMVEELDRRYQRYQDQMQLIVTSYESATGMGAAVPYTAPARKLISRQFRVLRDALGEHIQVACRTLGEDISSVPVLNKGETPRLRILDRRLRHHRTLQQVGMLQQHQAWRPQRGLPERAVAVLRAWLFEHFLHPYPKDSEKLMLARLTGLTRSQVANWFINARVRLWKPMVEQMYAEESKEVESQDAAEASVAEYGQRDNMDLYAWSAGGHHSGTSVTTQAEHVNAASSNHHCLKSQFASHESSHGTVPHNAMTKHGVSLTLGLQHTSSLELPSSSYNPNHHYSWQSAPGDGSYTFA